MAVNQSQEAVLFSRMHTTHRPAMRAEEVAIANCGERDNGKSSMNSETSRGYPVTSRL